MTKIRVLLFLLTLLITGAGGYFALMYARGYRFNPDDGKVTAHGLLAVKSSPTGAQIFLNHELHSATDTTISLPPSSYELEIKKEGYKGWSKTITIKEEEVTAINANLFKSAPSLSALTFEGCNRPIASHDQSKIAYAVIPANKNDFAQKSGLWVLENVNLPIGFSREARRITDGDMTNADWIWSPDGREIMLTTDYAVYLLNSGSYTPQAQRVNVAASKDEILLEWSKEEQKRLDSKLKSLPAELSSIITSKSKAVLFSPDETMVAYTASGSATLPEGLIKPLPGSSTQSQERKITDGSTYVYDIKEDKNFLIDSDSSNLILGSGTDGNEAKRISWLPYSRNIVISEKGKIIIADYDGTNRQIVYGGTFINPYIFTTVSDERLLILTDLGGEESENLYTLTIK